MKKLFFLLFSAAIPLLLLSGCDSKPVDNRAIIQIKTKPEKATITISGKDCGVSPVGGKLSAKSILIKAEKPGYETVWKHVTLTPRKKTEILLELPQLTSSIMLKTTPAVSAEVTFNGKKIGQTPLVIPGLRPGQYTATLKAPGYAPTQVSWTVDSKRPQMKVIKLFQNTGLLKVERGPRNASIKINGKNHGKIPYEIRLEQGEYDIDIDAPGYTTHTKKVYIRSNRTEVVRPVLTELPAKLIISSNPSGAFVTVNGARQGSAPLTIEGIKAGKVKVSFSMPNYDPVTIERGVAPGQVLRINGNLTSSLGSLEFVTIPAGVTVYLDNRKITVTEPDPDNKGYSKVFRINGLKPGEHTLRFIHKRATPSEKIMRVTVQKNKNIRLPQNVELWIKNARITLNVGTSYDGRLVREGDDSITFEHKQGSRMDYKRSELKKIERFKESE